MSETFSIDGDWKTVSPAGGQGVISAVAELFTDLVIKRKQVVELDLTSDAAVAVALGGSIDALVVSTIGGRATVRITHAGGATQIIPVNALLVLVTEDYQISALDVARETGVNVQVSVFFAEKA